MALYKAPMTRAPRSPIHTLPPENCTQATAANAPQGDLALAYRQFNQALDPELVESCIYQISAVKARCNYLIRAIKERSPDAAAAAALRLEEDRAWT